ncbi:unnamed protein product [Bursaphelenchus okinawaensis]|uniref:Ras-related protein Rab-28 n=1 Tax=Bursaphelenchus okinawaensis TaxID=465554 RepID=A0A811KRY1_9BILA|nr:unnamed protein product [Bursaphelenchus okinawaensis]CAG9112122.1 unnamed protein product [Bursaphelenchus okinawaensis]
MSDEEEKPDINSPRPSAPEQPKEDDVVKMLRSVKKDKDEDSPEKVIKLVLVGDGTSGKTSICTRFAQRDFSGKYSQTLGVDFYSRRLDLPKDNVLCQVWDVGGQSLSTNMLSKYVYDADCVVFVYDVTNAATFDSITDWVTAVKKALKHEEKNTKLALLGNKTDLEHRRAIRIDKHSRLADQFNMASHYVSAKTGDSIDLAFKYLAADITGVQLSKQDVEQAINSIRAPVAVLDANAPHKEPEIAKKVNIPQIRGTVVEHEAEVVDTSIGYSKDSKVCRIISIIGAVEDCFLFSFLLVVFYITLEETSSILWWDERCTTIHIKAVFYWFSLITTFVLIVGWIRHVWQLYLPYIGVKLLFTVFLLTNTVIRLFKGSVTLELAAAVIAVILYFLLSLFTIVCLIYDSQRCTKKTSHIIHSYSTKSYSRKLSMRNANVYRTSVNKPNERRNSSSSSKSTNAEDDEEEEKEEEYNNEEEEKEGNTRAEPVLLDVDTLESDMLKVGEEQIRRKSDYGIESTQL